MGNTWEPGRERFWDANETFEYWDSRSFVCVDDRFTPSVTMGGKRDADNVLCGDVGEDILADEVKEKPFEMDAWRLSVRET